MNHLRFIYMAERPEGETPTRIPRDPGGQQGGDRGK